MQLISCYVLLYLVILSLCLQSSANIFRYRCHLHTLHTLRLPTAQHTVVPYTTWVIRLVILVTFCGIPWCSNGFAGDSTVGHWLLLRFPGSPAALWRSKNGRTIQGAACNESKKRPVVSKFSKFSKRSPHAALSVSGCLSASVSLGVSRCLLQIFATFFLFEIFQPARCESNHQIRDWKSQTAKKTCTHTISNTNIIGMLDVD